MISDSTAIICLSRINQLDLLRKVFNKIIIPTAVKKEILIEDKPGYIKISKAINDWIKVVEPKNKTDFGLGGGENAVMNLAREKKDKIILDDAFGIKVAKTLDIEYIRTTTVIFLAVSEKIITRKQALKIINNLIEEGYYISPREYSIIFTKLNT